MSQAILILLPALCAALFVFPQPRTALRNYLLLLPFLPEYLVIDVGVKLTGSRIASVVFLLAMMYRCIGRLLPRWDKLDVAFAVFLLSYLNAVIPGPPEGGWIFAAGFVFDVALPYWFVRALVRTTDDLQHMVQSLLRPLGWICGLAAVQAFTGFGLFDAFKVGDDVFGVYDSGMRRLGLVRADVGLTHYIMMGLFFATQLPIAIGHYAGLGKDLGRVVFRTFWLPVGTFFSLSGGSFLVAFVGMFGWFVRPLRKLWFLLAVVALFAVVYIECFSNRGTLAILATVAATDGDSAWYRIRLPAAVFEKMQGHWWTGFGRDKPDMGYFNDITNHYLWWLMQAGIPCLAAFVSMLVVSLNRLYRSTQICTSFYLRTLNWGLAAGLIGIGLGMISVTLFGQMRSYLFVFMAMTASSLAAAYSERSEPVEEAEPVIRDSDYVVLPWSTQPKPTPPKLAPDS